LTTALVIFAVAIALGGDRPRFVALSCINIVVAANAGGAFSPFGDITTLMVWQRGVVAFEDFFRLFVPAVVNFAVPAMLMHFAVPRGRPVPHDERVALRIGARRIAILFALTIITAIVVHGFLRLPAVIGMMTGLGYLQLLDYFLQLRGRRRNAENDYTFNVFHRLASVEWDTLLFFYGVMMCVGALGQIGYLTLTSRVLYGGLGATEANVLTGVVSAVLDNIPLMYAVLTMHPDMALGQWLLITLTTGVGGSLLSIGSAAGVALMGQARGIYTFMAHLRWTWAVAAGYAAAVAVHMILNARTF
jgi:Na+/H+ antiporter NhaD/arsenite permease-like protein